MKCTAAIFIGVGLALLLLVVDAKTRYTDTVVEKTNSLLDQTSLQRTNIFLI